MNGLILHSYRRCPYAIRVRMTLEEKGLEYQAIEEDLSALTADLLRLHPEGKVPVLIHGDHVFHESAIITEYLDEAFPNPLLMPAEPTGRAGARLWTWFCDQQLKPDLDLFKYEWPDLDSEARMALLSRLRGHLSKLETALMGQLYLMGPEISLADIHVFPFYRQLQKARPDFRELLKPASHLEGWLERITTRPSFERVMRKPR